MKAPAFQFYAAEYLADEHVQLMTLEQEGAYIRLLAFCWREGSIPADPAALSMLTKGGSTKDIAVVIQRFKPHAENIARLVHPRLEAERLKQAEWREKSAKGGRKSGKARKRKAKDFKYLQEPVKGGSTKPQPVALTKTEPPRLNTSSMSSSSSSSASSTATPEEKKDKRADKPHDPRSKHPAIVAVQNIRGSYPPKELWDTVIELLGEHPDVVRLKKCWVAWRTKGYKPMNYGWLVDWYPNGIEGEANGTNKQRNGYKTAAEKRADSLRSQRAIVAELRGEGGGDSNEVESGERLAVH